MKDLIDEHLLGEAKKDYDVVKAQKIKTELEKNQKKIEDITNKIWKLSVQVRKLGWGVHASRKKLLKGTDMIKLAISELMSVLDEYK